jgi:NADPH:quinone reductase-like Zn-dependent oxidoreductase
MPGFYKVENLLMRRDVAGNVEAIGAKVTGFRPATRRSPCGIASIGVPGDCDASHQSSAALR